jgi:hypothetical protein
VPGVGPHSLWHARRVKRRWTLLFYSALGCQIGLSWLAKSLDISLGSFMGVSLIGMVGATVMGFVAMIRNIREKWPAAVVLTCAGPMVLDAIQWIDDLPYILRYFGPSFGLMTAGALATAATAIFILVKPTPAPPPGTTVAPARVVD